MAETIKRDGGRQRRRQSSGTRRRRESLTEQYPTFDNSDGLHVSMHRIRHVTARNVLRDTFRFQVPPLEEFGWEQAFNWVDYDTVYHGAFSRPGGRGLRAVSFETMFLDYDMPWTVVEADNVPDPLRTAQDLRQIMNSGTPFRLVVNQPRLWGERNDLDMKATLRSLRIVQRAGEIDCRYVNVEFVEWREIEVKTKKKGRRGTGLPRRVRIDEHTTYTLRSLSRRYYGSSAQWRIIVLANPVLQEQNVPPDKPLDYLAEKPPHIHSLLIPAGFNDRG